GPSRPCMILWLDEQLSPQLALWLSENFACEAAHVRDLGLARAPDRDVFHAARQAKAILLTKDVDFIGLLERLGPPPQVIWLTCGNMPNANLKRLLLRNLMPAITALSSGEPIVEIG